MSEREADNSWNFSPISFNNTITPYLVVNHLTLFVSMMLLSDNSKLLFNLGYIFGSQGLQFHEQDRRGERKRKRGKGNCRRDGICLDYRAPGEIVKDKKHVTTFSLASNKQCANAE